MFARCAAGFEGLLGVELKALGAQRVRPLKGGVAFFGELEELYTACLWSRIATRIQVVLARMSAADADELYANMYAFPWEEHFGAEASLAIHAFGQNKNLRNTQFVAQKAKDAICDRLRAETGKRPSIDPQNPDIALDISIHAERATIYLNVSGPALHRRGYREDGVQVQAPLKETLAAGMLAQAGWVRIMQSARHEQASGPAAFIDPMCGSGTLAIEAAQIATDIAPGLQRTCWGFSAWKAHNPQTWEQVRAQAEKRAAVGTQEVRATIVASDADPQAIAIAKECAKRAGVDKLITFFVADAGEVPSRLEQTDITLPAQGLLATNPPYGQRLLAAQELSPCYEALGKVTDCLPPEWAIATISPDDQLMVQLGARPKSQLFCFNGPLEVSICTFGAAATKRTPLSLVSLGGKEQSVAVALPQSEQFAARLRKMAKQRARWARQENIGCYRIYDADLPDYACAIDIYKTPAEANSDKPDHYAVVAEYRAPASIDTTQAVLRFADTLAITPAVLDIPPENVVAKQRKRARGGSQYSGAHTSKRTILVQEAGYTFELDLGSHLDSGLFLDHRTTRALVGHMAGDKRFLNLFAYTGSASVYAAGAGARSTTTVDMSKPYLAWAKRNMALNGFTGEEHQFICANVLDWLSQAAQEKMQFDLVFCDPPTFSNSKTMGAHTFDVQRDHTSLLKSISAVLAPDGTIVFSCNLRSFKLDESALAQAGLRAENITAETIPTDFERNPKIHSCFIVRLA